MLKEIKCLMCENFDFSVSNCFNHICRIYPNGIPDDVFEDNSDNKVCRGKREFKPKQTKEIE